MQGGSARYWNKVRLYYCTHADARRVPRGIVHNFLLRLLLRSQPCYSFSRSQMVVIEFRCTPEVSVGMGGSLGNVEINVEGRKKADDVVHTSTDEQHLILFGINIRIFRSQCKHYCKQHFI